MKNRIFLRKVNAILIPQQQQVMTLSRWSLVIVQARPTQAVSHLHSPPQERLANVTFNTLWIKLYFYSESCLRLN